MTEPLSLRLEVACSAEHAFTVWTSRIDHWWPADHTVTGRSDAEVVLEPYLGGRIYERTPDGTEHDWGEVTLWEPPHRLGYLWHLRRDRADATDVEIRFRPAGDSRTHVEIDAPGLGAARSRRRRLARPQPDGLDHPATALHHRRRVGVNRTPTPEP